MPKWSESEILLVFFTIACSIIHREGIEQANSDMEKNISDLEGYLRHLDDCAAAGNLSH